MENISCKPSTSTETSERNLPSTSTFTNKEKYQDQDEDEDEDSEKTGEFYFESEHLALKGNKDYLNLLKSIAILEAQRIKAIEDYDKLLALQESALQEPMKFVEKLQTGEDLGIPSPIVVAELPNIDWSAYNVSVPIESLKPRTRKVPLSSLSESLTSLEQEANDIKSKILVRGRLFDDSKPETFNQLWTAEEQRRLEELLVEFPPEEVETRRWQKIAAALGNRTTKQVCSRVQKYFMKLHKAGLPIPGRAPKVQTLEWLRKGYHAHRHQRNNHYLFKQTTFFPSQDVPVYMSDFDDETVVSCPATEYEAKVEDDRFVGEGTSVLERDQGSVEYKQLCLLQRVKKDKDTKDSFQAVQHIGYKCDVCEQDPIQGTRWHCVDCPPNMSVDFCTDCVVTQMEASKPHPPSHHLVDYRKSEELRQGTWDQDYAPRSFSGKPNSYNYLDPNFMPE